MFYVMYGTLTFKGIFLMLIMQLKLFPYVLREEAALQSSFCHGTTSGLGTVTYCYKFCVYFNI